MMHFRSALVAAVLGASFASGAAFATEPAHGDLTEIGYADGEFAVASKPSNDGHPEADGGHAAQGEHGDAHGDAAHGGDAHGDGAHHGPHYTGDVDADGTPNWADPDADDALGAGTYVLKSIGWHAFNLAVLVALIFFGFGATIRDAVRNRAIRIRTELDDAQELHAKAMAHHAAITARLDKLQAEIAAMNDRADTDVAAEAARIEERARSAAGAVADTAKRQIADEAARASRALKAEAVELAVELAEGILTKQMKADDQQRLASQFLASVDAEGPHV